MYDFSNQYGFFVTINGSRVTEYNHTDGNTYIEGRMGSEYQLELVNDSFERVLMIPSVDGLSIIDGKPAGLDSSGYIVESRSTVKIPGWKLDSKQAAKFVFDNAKDSYTKKSGQGTNNVGALGLLVFREEVKYMLMNSSHNMNSIRLGSPVRSTVAPVSNSNSGDWITTASAQCDSSPMGTGFGKETNFNTTEVEFKKRDPLHPDAMVVLYYDSAKGLEKKGIILNYRTQPRPRAFPKYVASTVGCVPPPGWDNEDRDDIIEKLLDRLSSEDEKDKMYNMLTTVETEKLGDAFDIFLEVLKR